MTAARAGRAQEGWGTGTGARNNSSGSHPAEEVRRRFIIAHRAAWARLGQPGSAPALPELSTQTTACLAANPGEISQELAWGPVPAFDLQPGRTQSHHPTASGARGGHGALAITARAALTPPLSASGARGHSPI